MSLEMKVPAVGESITEVTIASWMKNDGDMVEMDEVICELESDKATFEVTAEAAGKISIKAQEGDTLEIGGVLCEIDPAEDGEPASAPPAESASPAPEVTEAKSTGEIMEMKVPAVGESITEVTISSWAKGDGDFVELDEVIAEIESDKATFDLTAEAQGKLQIVAQEGDTLEIGALICKIEVMEGGGSPQATPASTDSEPTSVTSSSSETYATGHASPAAKKILDEKGIATSEVSGSGKDGRITKEDAVAAQKAAPAKQTETPAPKPQFEAPEIRSGASRDQRREKMSSLRKTVSRRLVSVQYYAFPKLRIAEH